jgi:hypothetical protein
MTMMVLFPTYATVMEALFGPVRCELPKLEGSRAVTDDGLPKGSTEPGRRPGNRAPCRSVAAHTYRVNLRRGKRYTVD